KYAVIVHGLHSPAGADDTVEVAGTLLELKDVFDYGSDDEDSSDELNAARNSEISRLVLGGGNDDVTVSSGDITHEDSYDLGDGENTLFVAEGNLYGAVTFGDGGSTLIVGEADIRDSENNIIEEGTEGDISGVATVSFGVGDNVLRVEDGGVT